MNLFSWRKKPQPPNTKTESPKDALFEQVTENVKWSKKLQESPKIVEHQFGESLGLRTRVLRTLVDADQLGIGPPDMIHATQFDKFHQEEVGEYHYMTGLDVSSEITPIAYLNALRFISNSSKTEGRVSTYCTTNIFSKVDIRIRYESEKHYQVNAIECHSGTTNVQLSQTIWEETFISGFIRSIIISKDKERKLPGLVEIPFGLDNGLTYCEKFVPVICKFLPRGIESGCDLTKHSQPSLKNNYLLHSLQEFLMISPNLYDVTIDSLEDLIKNDGENELCYRIAMIAIMVQSGTNDMVAIKTINNTIKKFYPLNFLHLRQHDLTNIVDLLCLQIEFLLSKNDYELALPIAKKITELSSDNFDAWYKLSECYLQMGEYELGLLSINSMPQMPMVDSCKEAMTEQKLEGFYYQNPSGIGPHSELQSNEFNHVCSSMKEYKEKDLESLIFGRIVMPNGNKRGYIENIWNGSCLQLGPIYGPQSKNLINFVSPQEVNSIGNPLLLRRNSMAKQLSWSLSQVYGLVMFIVSSIGWNSFLELRSKTFVMEREYLGTRRTLTQEIKSKRLCERWLDDLFLDIYDDLKIAMQSQEHREQKYSGLEWELLGLTLLRTRNWSEAVACLRTSIMARFDLVSAEKLLKLYLSDDFTEKGALDPDAVLALLVDKVSYESRFYDTFQLPNLLILRKLCAFEGVESIRNHVYALPSAQKGFVSLMDRFLDYIKEMCE
ncbi:LAFE_0C10968g1_1 [Lachancea fermentati]|uniref:LAFE_0C10968g1_1 n=1 Tax=Lachancea fermentati TaxID=4955 RepID=A0A1G4MA47_LACFM|nr:LAFE_0C10968g1_1 [Lachancea fermentati]